VNTSAKGIGFENAVVRHLAPGYVWIQRSAGSHSVFDIHGVRADGRCDHFACKNQADFGCVAAEHYADSLEPMAWTCHTGVFHRTKEKEFCEH
jgi:hypothetical protein